VNWLRRLFSPSSDPCTSAKVEAFRQTTALAEIPKPIQKFSGSFPMPTKAEVAERMQAAEDAAETLWAIQEREKERAAMDAQQPRNRVIPIQRVK
jgi:hypothetical protein